MEEASVVVSRFSFRFSYERDILNPFLFALCSR